ncbi:hypothetical protein OUY22_11090 [Nonomuraea sp. MCN248]|uniref:Uncharacterized protein n=1 Tax=Nonomuraea corallina TaxID=2989783 RepID=A0ABT4S9W6_9ACTN|nr:hypothetical protein [Nonomuraea corallina]MDA0633962.1 hypothetical protein [Nonomuraea corallina]
MADVGDQNNDNDAPTAPFRKIVVPAEEETIVFRRDSSEGAAPAPDAGPKSAGPEPATRSGSTASGAKGGPTASGSKGGSTAGGSKGGSTAGAASPSGDPLPAGPRARVGPVRVGSGPVRDGGLSGAGTAGGPFRPAETLPATPGPPPPPKGGLLSRIGDIPIKVVYLLGAIVATVAAVLLVFVIFSGDVPTRPANEEDVVPVAPVPSVSDSPTPGAAGGGATLPAVPSRLAFADLPGTATAVTGTVSDARTGISYPRLGGPWRARSFAPFAYAQRVGEVEVPQTVIASAMLPGATPETKPASDADYRAIAARAARWALRTQYPEGATLTWTGSRKAAGGEGWTLAFRVAYPDGGERRTGHALVSVLEVGKAKPAMLLASIPESGRAYWADLNTLAEKVRPL